MTDERRLASGLADSKIQRLLILDTADSEALTANAAVNNTCLGRPFAS